MAKRYNGYTNYETWAVSFWMSNDEGQYHHYRQLAEQMLEANDGNKRAAAAALADHIQNDHEANNPLGDGASVYTDLLGAALGSVNWHEIAKNQLED